MKGNPRSLKFFDSIDEFERTLRREYPQFKIGDNTSLLELIQGGSPLELEELLKIFKRMDAELGIEVERCFPCTFDSHVSMKIVWRRNETGEEVNIRNETDIIRQLEIRAVEQKLIDDIDHITLNRLMTKYEV